MTSISPHGVRLRTDGGTDATEKPARRLVLNPTSGTADHTDMIHRIAEERGYDVVETEYEEHAIELGATAAADGVDLLAVAGGDGTVNEVLQGLVEADALEDVTVGVVPAGTENLFARNIGVTDVETAFDVLDTGERRRIDVGFANGWPFVMSCIAGLPADASLHTSSAEKERLGSLAFLVSGLREAASFDGLRVDVKATNHGEETSWSGDALCALVGNIRQFAGGGGQANVEDGLFEVVVVERMPAANLLAEATAQRLLGHETDHVFHIQASQLRIDGRDGDQINFSVDGEQEPHDGLTLRTRPKALTVCVGPTYEPNPDDE